MKKMLINKIVVGVVLAATASLSMAATSSKGEFDNSPEVLHATHAEIQAKMQNSLKSNLRSNDGPIVFFSTITDFSGQPTGPISLTAVMWDGNGEMIPLLKNLPVNVVYHKNYAPDPAWATLRFSTGDQVMVYSGSCVDYYGYNNFNVRAGC